MTLTQTAPGRETLPDFDGEGFLRAGRGFGYTTVGNWVLLSPVSLRAKVVYGLLRMHCLRGSDRAWPGLGALAAMLGIAKTDSVSLAIGELVELGAVDRKVVRHATGRHNVYTVHEAPPDDYDCGPVGLKDFYDRHKASSPGVTPESGVTPKSGVMGHPQIGGHGSPPNRGSEVPVGEVPVVKAPVQDLGRAPDLSSGPDLQPPQAAAPQTAARCAQHQGLARDPGPCRGCQAAREHADTTAASAQAATRSATRMCRHCTADGDRYRPGTRDVDYPKVRCDHTAPRRGTAPKSPAGEELRATLRAGWRRATHQQPQTAAHGG